MLTARKIRRRVNRFLPLKALQILNPRDVIGFFYHVIASQPLPHIRHLYPHRPVDLFEQDLLYIQEHYPPVDSADLGEILARRARSGKAGKTALHLSFDDGFVECFKIVRPLLLKHRMPCTFFLATDFIDNRAMYYRNQVSLCISQALEKPPDWLASRIESLNHKFGLGLAGQEDFIRWVKTIHNEDQVSLVCSVLQVDIAGYLNDHQPYLTREQIRTLASEGFTIGAHSRRHQKLGRLSPAAMADEILGSCQAVAEITGQDSVPFSFPNSGDGVDRRFLEDLRKSHPEIGLIFDTKGLKKDTSFIVNRIWVEGGWQNPDGRRSLPEILHRAYLSMDG